MKKYTAACVLMLAATVLTSQESLKSAEEEYYDFLSLKGITERPTLGYRTLSDSQWKFIENETILLDENGAPVFDENGKPVIEKTMPEHPWQNNFLGKKYTLWQSENDGNNWFTRGFAHSVVFKPYGPEWYNSFNTAVPYGQNDGALWQGKGYNSSLTAGARLEAFGFELTVKPQVCFSQNLSFHLMPRDDGSTTYSEYAYFWSNIDLPQRFGDKAFWTYDWGDSEIRYVWKTFTIGFGTQKPWIGPEWLNSMIGSNNAPSYPKLDIGLRKTPIHIPYFGWYIGDFEARAWTGYLTESDYYDNDSSNDHNMIHALSLSFSPAFFKYLTFGVNRLFLYKWKTANLKNIYKLFIFNGDNSSGLEDDEDQKYSFSLDILFQKIGFEIFGEIGWDDHIKCFSANLRAKDFFINPSHTLCYTFGGKKSFTLCKSANIHGEVIFECSNFEMSQDYQFLWPYFGFNGHGAISQGLTNRGQLLGAASGFAGNTQILAVNVFYPKGNTMAFFHRNSPDTNFIHSKAVNASARDENGEYVLAYKYMGVYKTSLAMGLLTNYFITPKLRLSGGFVYNLIIDELYFHETWEIKNYAHTLTYNFQISLGAKYTF